MNRTILMAALLAGTAMAAVPAQADFLFGGTTFFDVAATTQLTVGGPIPAGNQPQNVQCIICGTQQPQQDGLFGYNNYQQGGNIATFLASSTSSFAANGHGAQLANDTLGTGYLGSFLIAYLQSVGDFNGVLNVGLDVNTAGGQGPEVLERFVVVDAFNHNILADTGPITKSLPTLNNGTGFPDYTITGFDLLRNDIQNDTELLFLARWSNASDGAESFFIVPSAVAVPGPIVGAGLPGLVAACSAMLGFNWRRRRRNAGV